MSSFRRIGEVAAATGLTVRTLHHYDEIGLLTPSARSEAGYRLYADDDVRRLYRIAAFRRLGFALDEIGALLDGEGADPRAVIRTQLERLDAEVAMAEKYYTPEQLAQLGERRQALGDEGMRKAQDDWAALIAEAEAEHARGTAPTDPAARELADRWA